MPRQNGHGYLIWLVPQALTAMRIFMGGAGLLAVLHQQAELAATWITLAPITDCLDGPAARKLKVTSEFGSLFDYFSDYLCCVVVPVMLSWTLLEGSASGYTAGMLGLPLAAGAARYARNAVLQRTQDFNEQGLPGLGTVFYGLLVAALVFLKNHGVAGDDLQLRFLAPVVVFFSAGMLLPWRYPKLMKFRWVLIPVVLGLAIMPFAWTTPLATTALVLIFSYAGVSPWLIRQARGGAVRPGASGRDNPGQRVER